MNETTAPPPDNAPVADADHGVAEFLDDLVSLIELQLELTVVDFSENARRAALPLGVAVFGLVVMAASVPVFLLGLALLVATSVNTQLGWVMILVAGGTAAIACSAAACGVLRLRRGFDSFHFSREEFKRNLVWLRKVLVSRRRLHNRRANSPDSETHRRKSQ
jgi:uncharacterized membrane protein YqjE